MKDAWNPEDYPEGHSPYCYKTCDDPCHDAYDEEKKKINLYAWKINVLQKWRWLKASGESRRKF